MSGEELRDNEEESGGLRTDNGPHLDADGEIVDDYRRGRIEAHRDPLTDDFQLGDPVIDLANGRTMIVVETPMQTVAEWSGDNDYDLTENYANARLRARPNDRVYGCVYAASIQSEPSGPRGGEGPYTFPSSRLARVTIESVEGVRRVYEAVAVDVLEQLFGTAMTLDEDWSTEPESWQDAIMKLAVNGLEVDGRGYVGEARELAEVEHEIGGDE